MGLIFPCIFLFSLWLICESCEFRQVCVMLEGTYLVMKLAVRGMCVGLCVCARMCVKEMFALAVAIQPFSLDQAE